MKMHWSNSGLDLLLLFFFTFFFTFFIIFAFRLGYLEKIQSHRIEFFQKDVLSILWTTLSLSSWRCTWFLSFFDSKAIIFSYLADVLNVTPSSFHHHVQLFGPTLGFWSMSGQNLMAFTRIVHVLSRDESKVDVINVSNQTLSNPSCNFEIIGSNFLINNFHDRVVVNLFLPVRSSQVMFMERIYIHCLIFAIFFLLPSMTMDLASDANLLFLLTNFCFGFLDLPNFVNIANTSYFLMFFFDKWIGVIKVDSTDWIIYIQCWMEPRIV